MYIGAFEGLEGTREGALLVAYSANFRKPCQVFLFNFSLALSFFWGRGEGEWGWGVFGGALEGWFGKEPRVRIARASIRLYSDGTVGQSVQSGY